MNIVTAADSGFFHCLKELADSVRKFYGKPIIVYDVGLTESEKKQLDAIIIPIEIPESANCKGGSLPSPTGLSYVRATHKPFCVKHYFSHYSEPMILVDADCLFTEKVELDGFDVGVTIDSRKIPRKNMYNGRILSGVVFFNNPAHELVDRWEKECMDESSTDQKALSDVLEEQIVWKNYKKIQQWNGLNIKILDINIYNDCHLRNGKIIHFATSKHRKDIYAQLIAGHKQGKNIRKMFNRIKRGKKAWYEKIAEKIIGLFKTN